MPTARLQVSRRQRATPYSSRVEALGVSEFSVVNHTILPKGFRASVEDDYWHLREKVQLWDVGCQRQVELRGPDAALLAQLMTPRDLRNATVGQCLYAPMVDARGGMLNDPVVLKIAEDHFWFSIADADMLLWADGLRTGMRLDVEVAEPDVWPVAVQGPRAEDVVAQLFGESVRRIGFFRFAPYDFDGSLIHIARSGYSKQGGFELYVNGFSAGGPLWDALWEIGPGFDMAPGCPNLIERIEGGLLSYGNEMTRENNPLECGLDTYCQLDGSVDFIGRAALAEIALEGAHQQIRGLVFDGARCPSVQQPWPVSVDSESAGYVTSAAWSPRFERNVALAMIARAYWAPGTRVRVLSPDGLMRSGVVTTLPIPDDAGHI